MTKTLPLIGKAFGQGVKEARNEIEQIKTDASSKDEAADGTKDETKTS